MSDSSSSYKCNKHKCNSELTSASDSSNVQSSSSDSLFNTSSDTSSQKTTKKDKKQRSGENDILTLFDANTKSRINRLLNMPSLNKTTAWSKQSSGKNPVDSKFKSLRKRHPVKKTRSLHSDSSLTSGCLNSMKFSPPNKLKPKKRRPAKKPCLLIKKSSDSFFHSGKKKTPVSKDVMFPNSGFDKFSS